MDIGVLGPLLVTVDGDHLPVTGELQRRLLAMLAHHAHRSVAPDTLCDAMWGDDQPTNPAAALHSQVARLRRTIGDASSVLTDASGYRLAAGIAIDAPHFEHLLGEAERATPDDRPALLRSALDLWRGDAYAEFADVEPLRFAGHRLDELRLVAVERYAQSLHAIGRSEDAVPELEHLLASHPFREQAVATLMRCLTAAGRQGEALRAYATYRDRLADELGLEPSASLRDLDRRIAVEDPSAASGTTVAGDHGVDERGGPRSGTSLEEMQITYAPSGRQPEIDLAVGRVGQGEQIVSVPAWVTSLDVMASSRDPRSALLERLASSFEVVAYDQPGTGLTRGHVTDFSVGGGAADLRAVIDHVGGGPVTLLAMSAAGPTAVLTAVEHPELVRRLILLGTYADPAVTFPDPEVGETLVRLVRRRWGMGSGLLAQLYRPGASDEAGQRLATILRDSAGPEAGAGYLAACYTTDVGHLLERVTQPALVIHYRGDRVIPFAGGQHLAATLPNARFVALDGRYHLPDLADVDRIERAIARFVDET